MHSHYLNYFLLVILCAQLNPLLAIEYEPHIIEQDLIEPQAIDSYEFLPSSRIVGGRDAAQGQFPYQVSVRLLGSHICGGSIISRNYIVTAAHCVINERSNSRYPASFLTVRAGSNSVNSGGTLATVAQIISHPNYRNLANDVALLRLSTPLTLTDRIKTIPLASAEVPAGAAVVISGWGRIRGGGPVPTQLKYNTLRALSTAECRRRIRLSSILCLAHNSGNGACQGDSGGPGTYNGQLVGITNFVIGVCGTNAPDGYAKISSFNNWIRSNSDL